MECNRLAGAIGAGRACNYVVNAAVVLTRPVGTRECICDIWGALSAPATCLLYIGIAPRGSAINAGGGNIGITGEVQCDLVPVSRVVVRDTWSHRTTYTARGTRWAGFIPRNGRRDYIYSY